MPQNEVTSPKWKKRVSKLGFSAVVAFILTFLSALGRVSEFELSTVLTSSCLIFVVSIAWNYMIFTFMPLDKVSC